MRLRPRHYLLLLIVLGLGLFNYLRSRRIMLQQQAAAPPQITETLAPTPPGSAATWDLFDKAAALRDAPDEQFQPALKKLNAQPDIDTTDVSGCKTWLLFYRQGKLHPSTDTTWQTRSTTHLDSCVKLHRDATK